MLLKKAGKALMYNLATGIAAAVLFVQPAQAAAVQSMNCQTPCSLILLKITLTMRI
jgi:hypothetical protein